MPPYSQVPIICKNCGQEFTVKKGRKDKTKFCSRSCYFCHLKKHGSPHKKRVSLTCEYCGKGFEVTPARAKKQRFCSVECNNKSRSYLKQVTKTCPQCEKDFVTYTGGNSEQVYCSQKCFSEFKSVIGITGKVIVYCANCNSPVQKYPSRLNYKRHFCNMDCKREFMTGRKSGYRNSIMKSCLICHRLFALPKSRKYRKYCPDCDGRKYEDAYKDIRRHGEEHPFFVSSKQKKKGRNWEEQAAKARKRDGKKCVICGEKGNERRLPVHHINPRHEFKTLEELETIGNRLDNLITLCQSCHMKAEWGLHKRSYLQSLIKIRMG